MTDPDRAARLAQQLEDVSEKSLDWLGKVLVLPIDEDNSALLRSQAAAANIALNIQVRVDTLRLQAQRQDKALERLIKLIAEKERTVPTQ